MQTYFYGHDFGNATLGGVVRQKQTKLGQRLLLNLSAPGTATKQQRRQDAEVRTGDAPLVGRTPFDEKEYLLTFRDSSTYHGELAWTSAQASTGMGDISRYWSERNVRALLVCSASILPDPSYALTVVTHLPIASYTRENKEKVVAALEGEHTFQLNGQTRRAIVQVSQVIMEGAGALIAYGLPDPVKQGVIDLGGYSTDLYATLGQRPRIEQCQNSPLGVSRIGVLLNERIADALQGHVLDAYDLHRVLHALQQDRDYPPLFHKGAPLSPTTLRAWARTAQTAAAEEIRAFIAATWRSNEEGDVAVDFARVLLVGGGAHYFRTTVLEQLPHVLIPRQPEMASAEGYALLAETLASRPALRSVSA